MRKLIDIKTKQHVMICNCSFIIATSGVSEPFILIDNKWKDLIDLGFKCPKCNKNIEYSNNDVFKYQNISNVKITK